MNSCSESSRESISKQSSELSAMMSSPSAGGMRLAGNCAQRASPGVRRELAVSKPIRISRSISGPGQLQDKKQRYHVSPERMIGSGGRSSGRKSFHPHRDRGFLQDLAVGAFGAFAGGVAQSLPIPHAPLLAGSLPPPSRFEDLPPLSLGPQANSESFSADCGSLSASFKARTLVQLASSCPANIGRNFLRPSRSKLNGSSMSVLHGRKLVDDMTESHSTSPGSKSVTALSVLESWSEQPEAVQDAPERTSVTESLEETDGPLATPDDVFELEGLDEVNGGMETLCLADAAP